MENCNMCSSFFLYFKISTKPDKIASKIHFNHLLKLYFLQISFVFFFNISFGLFLLNYVRLLYLNIIVKNKVLPRSYFLICRSRRVHFISFFFIIQFCSIMLSSVLSCFFMACKLWSKNGYFWLRFLIFI